MHEYDERLGVPLWWWAFAAGCVALLGAELHIGFGWVVAGVTYAVIGSGVAALLVSYGNVRVGVRDGELRAGRAHLPVDVVGKVAALDAAQVRRLRSHSSDAAAYALVRPYVSRTVYVEVTDPADPTPYWLVSTRHPDRLVAALASARRARGLEPEPSGETSVSPRSATN